MTDTETGPFVDTEDYEATQGHKPGCEYGEWGFRFFNNEGRVQHNVEIGTFTMTGYYVNGWYTALIIGERIGATVIKVVA